MTKLEAGMTREEAFALLADHNKDPFHIEHGETVEQTMRYFAREFDSENEDTSYANGTTAIATGTAKRAEAIRSWHTISSTITSTTTITKAALSSRAPSSTLRR